MLAMYQCVAMCMRVCVCVHKMYIEMCWILSTSIRNKWIEIVYSFMNQWISARQCLPIHVHVSLAFINNLQLSFLLCVIALLNAKFGSFPSRFPFKPLQSSLSLSHFYVLQSERLQHLAMAVVVNELAWIA